MAKVNDTTIVLTLIALFVLLQCISFYNLS